MQAMISVPQRTRKWLVAVFFLILLAIGMATVPDYGVPSDEEAEIRTLRYNVREYIRLFVEDDAEFDEYFAAEGVNMPTLREYFDHSYGAALCYPAAPILLLDFMSPYIRILAWHAYFFLLFMLGCWALYCVVKSLFGNRLLACLGVLLLYLSPLFFAEAHYNSKDTMMMAMTLVLLWQGLRLMQKPSVPRALLFALAGAVATNQRVIGLFVFGLIALFVLIRYALQRKLTSKTWVAAGTVLVSFFVFYYVLTPNAWGQPWMAFPETIATFSHFSWGGLVLFNGVTYQIGVDTLPRYYLIWQIIITTPIFLVLLMLAGQVLFLKDVWKKRKQLAGDDSMLMLLLCSVLWLLPVLYFTIATPPLYNGWRHYQFIYGPMIIMAVYGVVALRAMLKARWMQYAGAAVLAVYLVVTGVGMVQNHPYQFAYYNALAGDVESTQEGDYWFMAVHDTVRRLLLEEDHYDYGPVKASNFAIYRLANLPQTLLDELEWLPHGSWDDADYILMGARKEYASNNKVYFTMDELLEDYDEFFTVESYGNVIMRVYERNEPLAY